MKGEGNRWEEVKVGEEWIRMVCRWEFWYGLVDKIDWVKKGVLEFFCRK